MPIVVEVLPEEEFDAWHAAKVETELALKGADGISRQVAASTALQGAAQTDMDIIRTGISGGQ
jgi:heme/copper-type cytochrome/quinol oxidase subunit 2